MTLGDIIKAFRIAQDLSQRQFASRTGLSNNYISSIEMGKHKKPSIDAIRSIAETMSMSVNDLLAMMGDEEVSLTPKQEQRDEYVSQVTTQLRDNPKLRLLFDKTSKMSDKDMDAVLGVVNAILRETDDN